MIRAQEAGSACVVEANIFIFDARWGTARTSCSSVFSGMMTFWPPAWHAAQFPENTDSPAAKSPAKAGVATSANAAAAPATATLVSATLEIGALKARAAVTAESISTKQLATVRLAPVMNLGRMPHTYTQGRILQ